MTAAKKLDITLEEVQRSHRANRINKKIFITNATGRQVIQKEKKPIEPVMASPLHIKRKAGTKTLFLLNMRGEEGHFFEQISQKRAEKLVTFALAKGEDMTSKSKKLAVEFNLISGKKPKPAPVPAPKNYGAIVRTKQTNKPADKKVEKTTKKDKKKKGK